MISASVIAPAKINLDLRILGRRSDGYHEIQTLLQTIDLADDIRATQAPPDVLDLRVEPAGVVSSGSDNLMIRAAEALRRHTGVKAGARLELAKRIPVGAGLGGGSSDAAATLALLDVFWGLHLEPSELRALAADLGSDVPFFLTGGLAFATGRGEVVRPLPDLVDCGVVVCIPPIQVATADVYDRFASGSWLTSRGPKANVDAFAAGLDRAGTIVPPWQELGNDLEPVVVEKWPEVGRAVTALKTMGPLCAAVTGSGAAAFAVFPDLEAAGDGPDGLDPSWVVHVGPTLGRSRGRPVVK
ncbi:4-(cytidine 5'-diphospho)-2-C-methyl-D-erythritol kinase [Acidobacteriota bacterium]